MKGGLARKAARTKDHKQSGHGLMRVQSQRTNGVAVKENDLWRSSAIYRE